MLNRKIVTGAVALVLFLMLMPFGCERAKDELLMPNNTTNENQGLLKNGTNPIVMVEIDIKPGSDKNPVNVKSKGLIPVAILTTSTANGESVDMDATSIDPATLKFGPNEASIAHKKGHIEDVDMDGDNDLVVHFKTQDIGVDCGDIELEISGKTFSGTPISGNNPIVTVGCTGPASEGIFDGSGNEYTFVTIGTQDWLIENLKTTKYNDGTIIPLVEGATEWEALATPGYCWYNNNKATYGDTYGALYNWHAVNTGNLCPTGWHVPSDAEWTTLTTYLGGESSAGDKLKETGTTHWTSPNTGATNETGFTALPGGYRYYDGTFNSIGSFGFWWSASEGTTNYAWSRYMYYNNSTVDKSNANEKYGYSVRCLRD